jgi:hypothetical protein
MGRKSLVVGIRDIDRRLDRHQGLFARRLDALRARLRGVHPGWWLGGGVLAGYFAGRLGARATLRYARVGLRFASMVQAGFSLGATDQ